MLHPLVFKLIIKVGSLNQKHFLRALSRLEYGVSIHCDKLAQIAHQEGYHALSESLKQHAIEEKKHGIMLASLADRKNRIKLTGETGVWVDLRSNQNEQLVSSDIVKGGKHVILKHKKGIFNNLDGLSKRYLTLKILFNGQSADDFDWANRLAMMHVLESLTTTFYNTLTDTTKDVSVKAIASQIGEDEQEHSSYLKSSLVSFSDFPDYYIKKWENKILVATLGLFVDIFKIF